MFKNVVRLVVVLAVLGSVAARAVGEESEEAESFKPDADFWFETAASAMKEDRYGDAYLAASNALKLAEDKESRAVAYATRALVHVGRDRFDDAIAESTKGLELDPNCETALIARTIALIKLERFDSAIADCDRLVKLDPKSVDYYQFRSTCRREMKDWEKAVADAVKAIDLSPKEPEGYFLRGQAYAGQEYYRLAFADYKRAAELHREDDATYAAIVCMLVRCPKREFNDYEGAAELFRERCKTTKWKNALWISLLASVYAEAGDFTRAVEYQQKAVYLTTGKNREAAEHNLQLFKDGKTLDLANEELWSESEPLRR